MDDAVEKRMTIETKLIAGFLVVYIISAMVPGIVTYLVDHFLARDIVSSALTGLLIFCVLLILVVITGLYLMSWITKPVRKLCKAAEDLVHGNLNANLEVVGSAELISISESLSRMKSSLRIAHDCLGPPDLDKDVKTEMAGGLGMGEKLIIGMVIFLILNPLAAFLSQYLFTDSVHLSAIFSVMFSIILLSLIANYLYRIVVKPLRFLKRVAEKVSRGDYSENIEIRHSGDIGRLERNMILISERIERAMKELDVNG